MWIFKNETIRVGNTIHIKMYFKQRNTFYFILTLVIFYALYKDVEVVGKDGCGAARSGSCWTLAWKKLFVKLDRK